MTIDKAQGGWYAENNKKIGNERDKYLLLSNRELREGATQQPAGAKSTREPARQAPTVASVTRQQ